MHDIQGAAPRGDAGPCAEGEGDIGCALHRGGDIAPVQQHGAGRKLGNGTITNEDLAAALQGAVIKDEEKDQVAWKEYLENVMKKRGSEWLGLYKACRKLE